MKSRLIVYVELKTSVSCLNGSPEVHINHEANPAFEFYQEYGKNSLEVSSLRFLDCMEE